MINQIDSKWIKKIIISLLSGGILGKAISVVLGVFLTEAKWELFLQLWVPIGAISGLLIVLYKYQKEKENIID